jgi:peptide/nickel transport system substrate-binding protein
MSTIQRSMVALSIAGFLGLAISTDQASANPGQQCRLTTPAAEAVCGTIRMAITARTTFLDPTNAGANTDYQPMYAQQGMLYRYDENLVPRRDLVASETRSSDGLTITHVLRGDVRYSDGTPIQAEDVVFAFERWRAKGVSSSFIAPIVGVEATNNTTVVWKLSAPYSDFHHAIASHFLGIHPRSQIEAKTPEVYFARPLSAGPLVVVDWTPGSDLMVLRPNPHYWAKPQIEELRISAIPDATSRLLALQQGAIDYVFTLPLNAAQLVRSDAVTIFSHAEPGTFKLAVNRSQGQANPALRDNRVRQAISLAIDRARLADVGFFGIPEPACAYAFKPGNPFFQCSLPGAGVQNLAAARAMLGQTAWASGFSFEMIVPARPQWAEAAQVVAADLAKIGINAIVRPLPDTDILARLRARNYELIFFRNAVQTPILQLRNWFFPGGIWANFTGFENPNSAALLSAASASNDPATIKQLLFQLETQAVEDSTYIPLTSQFSLSGIRYARGVLEAVKPGEYLFVRTNPALPRD